MKVRIDPLDTLFSKYYRLKNDNICEVCGKGATQVHHYFGRRGWATRCDDDNVVAVCFSCHQWLHEDIDFAYEFFHKRLGSERYELLRARARTTKKRLKWEYEELKAKYRGKIKLLEKGE